MRNGLDVDSSTGELEENKMSKGTALSVGKLVIERSGQNRGGMIVS